jgi:hypothetical protein
MPWDIWWGEWRKSDDRRPIGDTLVCYTIWPVRPRESGVLAMKPQKPWDGPKRKKKSKPGDISKRYTLPAAAVEAIREAAAEYRSRGRVVQVATELLTRMDPPPTPEPALGEMQRMTYRIPQRTVDLIEELAKTSYDNDRAQVFAAGVKAIKMKKIK